MSTIQQVTAQQLANGVAVKKTFGEAMYYVNASGIFPDGTDVTDKLQALVNEAIAAGRKAIFFPHGETGEYYVTALENADQVVFFGDNARFVGGYDGMIYQIGYNSQVGSREIIPPADFGYTPPFTIPFLKRDGVAAYDYDVSVNAPTGKTYYVDVTIGNDANDGLTPASAFRTMNKALSMADIVVMRLAAGNYYWNYGPGKITKSISIIAEGGRAVISFNDKPVWAVSGAYTYTYEASRSAVASVWDAKILDENGDYTPLTQRASVAEVDANPGSWYTDGVKVYVRTRDSREVDNNTIKAYLNVDGVKAMGNITLYLENIDIEGGKSALRVENTLTSDTTKVYAKNSTFKYSSNNNGVTILGVFEVIFQDCIAARNYLDGFNYHIQHSVVPRVLELNPIGRTNGIQNGHNNNGSSMHDGGTIFRINGTFFGNDGPNIADVNDSFSWNVAVKAYKSAPTDSNGCNIYNDGLMWLDNCVSYGSELDLIVAGSGTTYIRDFLTEGNNNISSGSSVIPY